MFGKCIEKAIRLLRGDEELPEEARKWLQEESGSPLQVRWEDYFTCPCLAASPGAEQRLDPEDLLDGGREADRLQVSPEAGITALEELSVSCPALRHVLLRPEHLEDFKRMASEPVDVAQHHHVLLLAHHRGYLSNLTGPIHRFFLNGNDLKSGISSGGLNALREHWMEKSLPADRFRRASGHMGKLVELGLASWLEANGWQIETLDAFAPSGVSWPDIRALDPKKDPAAIEVKFLGIQIDEFEAVLESLQGGSGSRMYSPYEFCDYLMFRVYEAALQLRSETNRKKIAAIVVSDQAWQTARLPIEENWITWSDPKFFFKNGTIEEFVKKQTQKSKYKNLFQEWAQIVSGLDLVWILREREFAYELVQENRPRG